VAASGARQLPYSSTSGATAGSIIAAIIAAHMPMNAGALMSKVMARPTWASPCTIDDMAWDCPAVEDHATASTPTSTSAVAAVVSEHGRAAARAS